MKNLNQNLFLITTKVVIWLFLVFNLGKDRSPKTFYPLLQRLDFLSKKRGMKTLVSMLKDTRVVLLNYLAGTPIRIKGVKSTKDGLPIILGDLIPIIRREPHPDFLRVITTILFCTRALNLGSGIDLNDITGPAKQAPSDISKHIPGFWKELGYRKLKSVPRSLRWKQFHLTTKVGPNSNNDNALWTALCDLSSLPASLEASVKLLGGPKLENKIDNLFTGIVYFKKFLGKIIPFERAGMKIRKLSSIKDKELKVRVIAIGDYWSQTALISLHNYLYNVLRKIPQDCTFAQGKGVSQINGEQYFYSADLKSATDRFPITTISEVLSGLLPADYISAWKDIMVGYPFDVKQGKETLQVTYSVGNPMGFYSSWASFTVAHHYVIYYCCKELNIDWKTAKYVILGDDIVICDPNLAKLYKSVITSLGVEISAPKTYESKHFYEFAKRLFYKGVEITPFPISGLREVSKKYYLLAQFFIEAEGKGWLSPCGVPVMVDKYYELVLGISSSFRKRLVSKVVIYEAVHRIIRGAQNAAELLEVAFRELGYQYKLSNFVALNVLENIAVDLYSTNNPMSNWKENIESGKFSLYQIEFALLGYSLDVQPKYLYDRYMEFIKSLPTHGVVTMINNAAMDAAKEARGYSTGKDSKWPLLLKATAYPVSKDILTQRSSYLISKTASKIAIMLKDRAEILGFYDSDELLRETPD